MADARRLDARAVLARAGAYTAIQRALGSRAVHRALVDGVLRPRPGERILDLGCGPGDVLAVLPEVDYLGVDVEERYLAAARRRWSGRARFRRLDVTGGLLDGERPFDAVLAIGLLHHLDDAGVETVLELAAGALGPGGRLVTLDPGHDPGQPRVAAWLIARDRGAHIRSGDEYRRLAATRFESVALRLRHDLARVPYTHAILQCHQPKHVAA